MSMQCVTAGIHAISVRPRSQLNIAQLPLRHQFYPDTSNTNQQRQALPDETAHRETFGSAVGPAYPGARWPFPRRV